MSSLAICSNYGVLTSTVVSSTASSFVDYNILFCVSIVFPIQFGRSAGLPATIVLPILRLHFSYDGQFDLFSCFHIYRFVIPVCWSGYDLLGKI